VLVPTPPSSHLDVAGLCFEAGRTLSFLDGASETVEFAAGDPRHSGKGELDGPRGSMGQAAPGDRTDALPKRVNEWSRTH